MRATDALPSTHRIQRRQDVPRPGDLDTPGDLRADESHDRSQVAAHRHQTSESLVAVDQQVSKL